MSLPEAPLPPARSSAQNRSRALQAEIMELRLRRHFDGIPAELAKLPVAS